jgi:hypothetical protein
MARKIPKILEIFFLILQVTKFHHTQKEDPQKTNLINFLKKLPTKWPYYQRT